MVWSLEKNIVGDFKWNPLATVAMELRFNPLRSIETGGSKVAEYQECIRSIFPTYSETGINDIKLDAGSVSVSKRRAFEFGNKSGTRKLRLTSENLSLIRTDHKDRTDLISEVQKSFAALQQVFDPVDTIRFGIVYSNIVDKSLIEKDAGESVSWRELIMPEYFPAISSNADEDRLFWTQIRDSVGGRGRGSGSGSGSGGGEGELVVRYGLVKQVPDVSSNTVFRLDIDRSINSAAVPLGDSNELVVEFADDVYSMFCIMANDKLMDWMRTGIPSG